MSEDIKYLRMTVDVAVFARGQRVAKELLSDGSDRAVMTAAEATGKEKHRFHPWGTGEQLARRFMAAIISGDIEIDDVRDVEDHTS